VDTAGFRRATVVLPYKGHLLGITVQDLSLRKSFLAFYRGIREMLL